VKRCKGAAASFARLSPSRALAASPRGLSLPLKRLSHASPLDPGLHVPAEIMVEADFVDLTGDDVETFTAPPPPRPKPTPLVRRVPPVVAPPASRARGSLALKPAAQDVKPSLESLKKEIPTRSARLRVSPGPLSSSPASSLQTQQIVAIRASFGAAFVHRGQKLPAQPIGSFSRVNIKPEPGTGPMEGGQAAAGGGGGDDDDDDDDDDMLLVDILKCAKVKKEAA
jgi:hypothetical protein